MRQTDPGISAAPVRGNADRRLLILVLLITVAALGRIASHDFVQWDDPQTIAANPAFNPPTLAGLKTCWTTTAASLYVPLTYSAWWLLATIARVDQPDASGSLLNPWIFHAASLAVHLACTALVFRIVKSLARRHWAAFFAAAVFALHPVQVETVAWASGFKDLLCTLFMLVAISELISFRNDQRPSWHLVIGFLTTLCACLSKPTGVITPFIALAVDALILATPLQKSVRALWPWVIIALAMGIVGARVQPPLASYITPAINRPAIAADAIAFYLWKLVAPIRLAIDYGRTPQAVLASGEWKWTWLFTFAATVLVWFIRRNRLVLGGAIIAVLGVSPVLGLVPFTFQVFSTVADHYLYPSMLGVAMIVAAALGPAPSVIRKSIASIVVLVLASLSLWQAGYWRDGLTLFPRTFEVNPQSAMAHTNLAAEYRIRGDHRSAEAELNEAVRLDPDDAFAHSSLAAYAAQRRDARGVKQHFDQVLRIYATQRNFEPNAAAKVTRSMASMLDALGDHTAADAARQQAERFEGRSATSTQASP